jgi:hypothetical protein
MNTARKSTFYSPAHTPPPPVFSETGFDDVRPAANIRELEEVYRLTHECYVAQSYVDQQPNGLLLHYPEFDVVPETTVLVATHQGEIVGSVSYTVAGTNGLTIGQDFREECLQMEKEGRSLCAIWRLVVKKSHRASRQVVFGLISEATRRLLNTPMNTFLFVVNPAHKRVYERLLNMRVAGTRELTDGLYNAPAVLLRGDRETLPEKWRLSEFSIRQNDPIGLLLLEPALHVSGL